MLGQPAASLTSVVTYSYELPTLVAVPVLPTWSGMLVGFVGLGVFSRAALSATAQPKLVSGPHLALKQRSPLQADEI